jgi:phospholipase C
MAIALDVRKGHEFEDSGDPTKVNRIPLPLVSAPIRLEDIVLPVVFINIAQQDEDQWIFDYRVTYFFGDDEPYSSTTTGVVLDQNHHKHMGVYNGRPFPTLAYPKANLVPLAIEPAQKSISLSFLQKKFHELINNRQGVGSQDPPFMKLRLSNTGDFGDQLPQTYADLRSIRADPPGVKYPSNPLEIGQIKKAWGFVGFYLNDINSKSLTLNVNPGNAETPISLHLQFETEGPEEVGGTRSMDITNFEIQVQLTLRFDENNQRVDLMAWVDDINHMRYTPEVEHGGVRVTGTFLGKPVDTLTRSLDLFRTNLIDQVLHVVITAGTTDFGGSLQKNMRENLFDMIGKPDPITQISIRDSLNATANSWLMGGVIGSGNPAPLAFPNPNRLVDFKVDVEGGILKLNYIRPERKLFSHQAPRHWPRPVDFSPGTLANIDHIIILTQENRSFDHMLGYLSLPSNKGGMNRHDVDGLKGDEFNMLNGKRCESFRFAAGDTIFRPGAPNATERVLNAINNGRMDRFVQSQFDEFGPDTAHKVMGYHTADNVPTYDALARDFAICHRWFASHPGPTFPNRFYELTGAPNIDPWGVWEYGNSSPLRPVFTDTIFDHLTERSVSWRYFEHGYCFLRFFERYTFDSTNIVSFDDTIVGFEALAKAGDLPAVSFVDPHFVDLPPNSTCDEAPSDIRLSQAFIRKLVEILVSSPKWNKTLLLITYDEHGGFYDHVPPVRTTQVSPELLQTTGARVPAFVVSPWVKGGVVFGTDALHFDHTSILKTIARRFMSTNPPYMGARYAAAHDLSEVLGNELRPSQFLPFIPYNFVYGASQKRLAVQGAAAAPGTILWQDSPNDTSGPDGFAQQFSFEDASDDYYYIRTRAGGLYVTADDSLRIKQEVKYPTDGSATSANNLDRQRWKFTSNSIDAFDRNSFAIWNAAFPGKVMQPASNSHDSGAPIILGDPQETHVGVRTPNPWQVTSPLLPGGQVLVHP